MSHIRDRAQVTREGCQSMQIGKLEGIANPDDYDIVPKEG
ncbi:hypothetical protein SAMN05443545_106203 [Aidingimonas halophila]|uniref:Uncharacterized protein n=1 Tax=Aidingimonas halophila TaxID=574349 RepID=A0A1H3D6I6_9GAMM|nr:hypothetical protein SAMN05443545_106203 [Aidingimonas halophila]